MNSLFVKILVWYWATLAIFVVGTAVISALTADVSDPRAPASRLVSFQLTEARYAYETGGREGLRAFMQRLRTTYRGRAFLTDAEGRDLLTGENRANLVARARRRERPIMYRPGGMVLMRSTEDGRYWFFLFVPRHRLGAWVLQAEHWWVLALGVLLCYLLAYHLTRPVRQLQRAVERFGHGDLTARAPATRSDELGQLAGAFNLMAERIQTLLEAEKRLLRDISHELRSPLARLGVAIELARSEEGREAALNRIAKESERINSMVGELLEVTRVEGDPNALRAEPLRLDDLLRELVEDGAIEARARGCELALLAAEPVTIKGDAELLRRAIENVVRNAIRYAPPDTKVEVSLARRNGSVVVRVRDYGPGVPEESLTHIFDAFYRVESDRARGSGGVGLGLAIARRAVDAHHGRITASNAGPGLAVEIDLREGDGARGRGGDTASSRP